MSSDKDIVVTNLSISQKEQQLKQRFLSNTRPETIAKPVVAAPTHDPGLTSFLEEMQNTLKQQATGSITNEIMKKQANVLQQHVDLLREEQKNMHLVVKQMSRPQGDDSKRLIAELLAPLNKQIIEVKNYYEETKNTAKELVSQVADLQKTIKQNKNPSTLKKSMEDGLGKFAQKKAAFDNKIKEAEEMTANVMNETEDKLTVGGYKQGIDYLRQQIEAVQKDTEKIEVDLLNRYQRILQQVQKVKAIPSEIIIPTDIKSSEERIGIMLGGSVDYDEILSEVEQISNYKNLLIQEYRKGTPVYPKVVKPVIVQVPEKKIQKKPMQMHPVPSGIAKKTLKTKPTSLQGIPSQPKQMIPKPNPPKSFITAIDNPILNEKPEEKPQKSLFSSGSREVLIKKPVTIEKPPTPGLEENSKEEFIEKSEYIPSGPIPRAQSPAPFQTKPGITKGEQTSNKISFADIYPSLKNIETQEPPKATIEQQTIDAVTEYILTQMIKPEKKCEKIPEANSCK